MNGNQQIVFFIGKPGSGKTTQAKTLSEKTNWPVFTPGATFRELSHENTTLGRKVKETADNGLLMPPWFAVYVYLKLFFSIVPSSGGIFDGAGRKVPEAEIILESLEWFARSFTIIHVTASDKIARARLAKRAKSASRSDDDSINTRFDEYYEYTEKAVNVFRKSNAFIELDGEQDQEFIAADIRTILHIN